VLTRLTSDSGLTTDPALSADGKLLAYASDRSGEGNLDIWVRQVGGVEPIRLTRDPADEHEPAFSPDGTKIAFRSEREGGGIYVVSALGGPARRIAPEGRRPQFSPDGNWIAYGVGGVGVIGFSIGNRCRIYVVASAGAVPRQIQPDFAGAVHPIWSPDGKHLLFLGSRDNKLPPEESIDWWVTPLAPGPAIKTGALEVTGRENLSGPFQGYPWTLVAAAWEPAGDGLVFSARSGDSTNLWRIRISPKTWKVTGSPQRLTSGPTLEVNPSVASGPGETARMAFASLNENVDIWSLPIEPNQGRVVGELQRLTQDAAADFHPALSPDGARMVFVSGRTGHEEVWTKDLRRGEDSVLTASRSNKWEPHFSRDGSKVSFSSYENKKWIGYVVPASGGVPEMICEDCGEMNDWSSDGKHILGHTVSGRVWLLELASRRMTELLAPPGRWWASGRFSPDERWITLLDGRSWHSYVAPFQGEASIGQSALITITEGLMRPWSPDGTLLYGWADRDGFVCLWAQRLDPATKRPAGAPFAIFHSHSARLSLANGSDLEVDVARDKIVFSMGERTGNIWMAEFR
jgi:Tol biopolymer transport system component